MLQLVNLYNLFNVNIVITSISIVELQLVNKFGGEAVDFVADRPFVFYIEDETTGAKLFAGRVSDPSKFKE